MARHSHDRENLLRDATAFTRRVQFAVDLGDGPTEVFAGFRANNAASIYFDQDPVYHFNANGEMRRAFVDGLLIKAEDRHLVVMRREHGESEVAMRSTTMTDDAQREFCQTTAAQLGKLRLALVAGAYRVEGQVTAAADANVSERLLQFLETHADIHIAASPRVAG